MSKKEETTSFVIRFTQKVFEEKGETQVQWRGNIRHVQGGEDSRFSDFNKAIEFMQEKLAALTIRSVEHKPEEEQKGILRKSFKLWKRLTIDYPMKVLEKTIKDPKAQVEQIQNQVSQVGEKIGHNLESELNQWRSASKADFQQLLDAINGLSEEVKELKKKIK